DRGRAGRPALTPRMDLQLDGKVVLITGASGGIGRALAEQFAAEGCRLALVAHARGAELEQWLAGRPWRERALALPSDVRQPEQIAAACERATAGLGRLDACVVNAGVWLPPPLPLHE